MQAVITFGHGGHHLQKLFSYFPWQIAYHSLNWNLVNGFNSGSWDETLWVHAGYGGYWEQNSLQWIKVIRWRFFQLKIRLILTRSWWCTFIPKKSLTPALLENKVEMLKHCWNPVKAEHTRDWQSPNKAACQWTLPWSSIEYWFCKYF